MPTLTRFYEAVGAMYRVHEDAQHAVLEVAGFELVIHAIPGESPPGTGEAVVREDSYLKVCLPVSSIAAARARAAALGGKIHGSEREWEAPERGFRACDGHDPEGNVIQVREPFPGLERAGIPVDESTTR